LVNNKIKIWSPSKKKLYGEAEVVMEYGIHPKNFVIYRALDGDISDNIPSIKGFGLKTVIKAFPFLCENRKVEKEEIYDYCEKNIDKLKVYQTLIDNKIIFERNILLMQLIDTLLQPTTQLNINDILSKPITKLNRYEFIKLINEDQMKNNLQNYNIWLNEVWTRLDNFASVKKSII
jgi:5'-3' exonuclease